MESNTLLWVDKYAIIRFIEETLTFDSENRDDVFLFKQVCTKLGITTSDLHFRPYKHGWWYVRIHGWDNFKIMLVVEICF